MQWDRDDSTWLPFNSLTRSVITSAKSVCNEVTIAIYNKKNMLHEDAWEDKRVDEDGEYNLYLSPIKCRARVDNYAINDKLQNEN